LVIAREHFYADFIKLTAHRSYNWSLRA
jgi:hypothetical protein